MAEILHFEILRKHGQTNTQTNRHGHYNTSPSPYGGRGKYKHTGDAHHDVQSLFNYLSSEDAHHDVQSLFNYLSSENAF